MVELECDVSGQKWVERGAERNERPMRTIDRVYSHLSVTITGYVTFITSCLHCVCPPRMNKLMDIRITVRPENRGMVWI